MAPPAPIEALIAVSRKSEATPDEFINKNPLASHGAAVAAFGGSLLGQAITAAGATVPTGFNVFASQSVFIRKVEYHEKIAYKVERTHDGRSYATRTVKATQGNEHRYTAILSYQSADAPPGQMLKYALPMPDTQGKHPDRDELMDYRKFITGLAGREQRPKSRWQLTKDDAPLEWRLLGPDQIPDDATELRILKFARSAPISTDDPSVHLAALAYLTDEFSVAPAIAANMAVAGGALMGNVTMAVTLTHNMSFHDAAVRADEWLLVERGTSWAADGRACLHQNIWLVESGKLVLSCDSEFLFRLDSPKL